MKQLKSELNGSMTVEMSVIAPVILSILMLSILAGFYYHDKNILYGAAYETAVVGSTKMREKEQPDTSELVTLCKERIGRKCIFFGNVHVESRKESSSYRSRKENQGYEKIKGDWKWSEK